MYICSRRVRRALRSYRFEQISALFSEFHANFIAHFFYFFSHMNTVLSLVALAALDSPHLKQNDIHARLTHQCLLRLARRELEYDEEEPKNLISIIIHHLYHQLSK
jgi:hypothetical protein